MSAFERTLKSRIVSYSNFCSERSLTFDRVWDSVVEAACDHKSIDGGVSLECAVTGGVQNAATNVVHVLCDDLSLVYITRRELNYKLQLRMRTVAAFTSRELQSAVHELCDPVRSVSAASQ